MPNVKNISLLYEIPRTAVRLPHKHGRVDGGGVSVEYKKNFPIERGSIGKG